MSASELAGVMTVPGDEPAGALFTLVPALIGIGFVVIICLTVYRFFAARRAGLDPLAADLQLMGAARESQLLRPERSVEDRLAEVDALRAAGTISADEHAAARARILGSV